MASFRLKLLLAILLLCLGAGGAAGSAKSDSQVPDNVKVFKIGRKLELSCNTTKPDPEDETKYEYDWYKDNVILVSDDRQHVFANGTLRYDTAENDDIGEYMCKARKGGPIVKFTAVILSYKKLPKSGIALQGDKLVITCEVEGNPIPVISWTKDNQTIAEAMGDRLSFRPSEKYPPNSTIEISDVQDSDRGEYTCFFSNYETGVQPSTSTFIRVKDMYAALWPFLGIVAEVVILCLVIFIYEKRRSKNDFEESDTDQGGSTKGGRT